MRLQRSFYTRDPRIVAPELLGKVFVCRGKELIITETEAYLGSRDLASHARFGPTARTKIMWEDGGHLYVYLIYGVYELVNIVTGKPNEPGAVLIRGGVIPTPRTPIIGPGKFTDYLGITRDDKAENLVYSPTLFIDDRGITVPRIEKTHRIGVGYAGSWAHKKMRYSAML